MHIYNETLYRIFIPFTTGIIPEKSLFFRGFPWDFAMRTYYTHAKYCEIGMFVEVLQIPVRLDRERFCYVIAQ